MFASASPESRKRRERSYNPGPARIKGGPRDTNDATPKRRTAHGSLYSPGDAVRESGIYEVVHDASHRYAHEVVMISGDHFPTCETCETQVRFRLIRTAPYIFADEDFEEEK